MGRIEISVEIAASPAVVWADVRHIPSHVTWMVDAEEIRMTSGRTEGVGTTFDCDTKVGPLRLTDHMEITEWEDERVMGVRHVGVVTGVGKFTLRGQPGPGGETTRFTWEEDLTFPWWLGAGPGEAVGGPVLRGVWRRNLRQLRARIEGRPLPAGA